jgi:hypothetical protein
VTAVSADRRLWNYPKTGVLGLTSALGKGMSVHLKSVFLCAAECFRRSYPGASIFKRIPKIAKVTINFVVSVRPSTWNNSAPTGRIFMKFDMSGFLE